MSNTTGLRTNYSECWVLHGKQHPSKTTCKTYRSWVHTNSGCELKLRLFWSHKRTMRKEETLKVGRIQETRGAWNSQGRVDLREAIQWVLRNQEHKNNDTSYMPGSILSVLSVISFHPQFWGRYNYHPHFPDEDTVEIKWAEVCKVVGAEAGQWPTPNRVSYYFLDHEIIEA